MTLLCLSSIYLIPEERYYENVEDSVYENYDFSENRIFQEVAFKDRRPDQEAEAGIQQFIRSIEEVSVVFYKILWSDNCDKKKA